MPGNSNVYALLVGIDAYQSPVPALRGCRNDIDTFGELLSARGPGDTIHIRTLLDEQATRAGVIAGFREHLAQAGEDDAALFYYSGHGSQEPAPEQWWHLEPDHLDETLVLYDSRAEGQWDLADKELAALIAEVAANHPHVVVVPQPTGVSGCPLTSCSTLVTLRPIRGRRIGQPWGTAVGRCRRPTTCSCQGAAPTKPRRRSSLTGGTGVLCQRRSKPRCALPAVG
jgi:hypothetical protein